MKPMVWQIGGYGLMLAAGAVLLQWLDYRQLIFERPGEVYVGLVAMLFLAVGIGVGAGALRRRAPMPFDGNPQAVAALRISARELAVLQELAAGVLQQGDRAAPFRFAAYGQDACRPSLRKVGSAAQDRCGAARPPTRHLALSTAEIWLTKPKSPIQVIVLEAFRVAASRPHPRNERENGMLRNILKYGAIGGVTVGVLMASTMWLQRDIAQAWGMVIGYLTMLIALSTVFVAIKRRRDFELGGVIRFLPALGLGLGISVVAAICYALAWEIIMPLMPGDFIGEMIAKSIADQRASGASEAQISAFAAEMEAFRRDYDNPLYRMPLTFTEMFPVGVLVSFVSAGLLCNRRFLPARAPLSGAA